MEDSNKEVLDAEASAGYHPTAHLLNSDIKINVDLHMQLMVQRKLHEQFEKYRIAKYLPESAKGNPEKRTSMDTMSQIENITGLQFKDALQMQLSVQRQLHEKLEIQRSLQMRIEEQAKQLKKLFDQHQQPKANKSSSSDNYHSTNLDDDEILNLEDDSENTIFQSKIS